MSLKLYLVLYTLFHHMHTKSSSYITKMVIVDIQKTYQLSLAKIIYNMDTKLIRINYNYVLNRVELYKNWTFRYPILTQFSLLLD